MKRILLSLMVMGIVMSIFAQNIKRPESYNYQRGIEAVQQEKMGEALEYFNKDIQENPKSGYPYMWISYIYLSYEEYGRALEAANSAIELLPKKDVEYLTFAYSYRSKTYLCLADTTKAIADCSAAIKIDNKNTDMYNNRTSEYGHWPGGNETGLSKKSDVYELIKNKSFDAQIKFAIESVKNNNHNDFKNVYNKLTAATTVGEAVGIWLWGYERPGTAEAHQAQREKFAMDIYNVFTGGSQQNDSTKELTEMNEDIYELFFSAINKTAQNTESMRFELKNNYHPNKNDSNKVMMVSAANSQNNAKLAKLFDCILNTPEYFRYVNKLYWVYDNMVSNLIRVDVKLSSKDVPTNQQRVFFYSTGSRDENGNASRINVNVDDLSDDCKKSLKKRYDLDGEKKLKCLVPELADPNNLTAITISDCASVVATLSSSLDNSIVNGKIGNWDVMASVNYLLKYAKEHTADGRDSGVCKQGAPYYCEKGRCYAYVKRALAEGNINVDGVSAYEAADKLRQLGFKNILTVRTDTVDYESKKLGDITVFDKCSNHQHGHITMWCGNQWVSDFKQMNNRIKKGVVTKCTVWRYYG